MRRLLLTLLAVVVIVGVLAGAGYIGYRFGYQQGSQAAANGDNFLAPFARGDEFNGRRMPMHEFGWSIRPGFQRGFGDFGMMAGRGRGFGIFPLFGLLVQLAILGFIVWLVYKLLTGWRLSFTRATPESPRVEPVQSDQSETKPTEEQSN